MNADTLRKQAEPAKKRKLRPYHKQPEENISVCLNCTLPASKCLGGYDCYLNQNRKRAKEADG